MANPNPDTSGLKPFNTIPNSESAVIQSAGGIASAQKRRELKTIKHIIQDLRMEATTDPVALAIMNIFEKLQNEKTTIAEIIKSIEFIYSIIGEKPTDCTSGTPQGPVATDPEEIARISMAIRKMCWEEEDYIEDRKARERNPDLYQCGL